MHAPFRRLRQRTKGRPPRPPNPRPRAHPAAPRTPARCLARRRICAVCGGDAPAGKLLPGLRPADAVARCHGPPTCGTPALVACCTPPPPPPPLPPLPLSHTNLTPPHHHAPAFALHRPHHHAKAAGGIRGGGDHLVRVLPAHNLLIGYAPQPQLRGGRRVGMARRGWLGVGGCAATHAQTALPHLAVDGPRDEAPVVRGVEVYRRHKIGMPGARERGCQGRGVLWGGGVLGKGGGWRAEGWGRGRCGPG